MTGRRDEARELRPDAVLFDLLMAVMNSLLVWEAAAGNRRLGMEWRDAVTARMVERGRYQPYEELVRAAASAIGLPPTAPQAMFERWTAMEPWPDAHTIAGLPVPYAFVTNCSTPLGLIAAQRSGLAPRFVLAAEETGWFKPAVPIYREACARLGTAPERTAFVAGSPYDAAGAAAAGLPAWLVRRRDDQPAAGAPIRVASSLADALAEITARYSKR